MKTIYSQTAHPESHVRVGWSYEVQTQKTTDPKEFTYFSVQKELL